MATTSFFLEETNLSHAWYKVLDHMLNAIGKDELTPLLLTLTDFKESKSIRHIIDEDLDQNKATAIDTVSETIFPESLYILCKRNRHMLYDEYKTNLPRIHKLDRRNRRGTYFERLIDYNGKNQLEIIIKSILEDASVRRSKLQASIFNPEKDHLNGPYQGFPCLQHVTFFVTDEGLVINSFYAIQLLYKKAYGNWLGLINLGKFIANELNIKLERFNCFIGIEQLEINKTDARKLLLRLEESYLAEQNSLIIV